MAVYRLFATIYDMSDLRQKVESEHEVLDWSLSRAFDQLASQLEAQHPEHAILLSYR